MNRGAYIEIDACDIGLIRRGPMQMQLRTPHEIRAHEMGTSVVLSKLGKICLDWRGSGIGSGIAILPSIIFSRDDFLNMRVLLLCDNRLNKSWNGNSLCSMMTKLVVLKLDRCQLEELPENIGDLVNLELLYASHNKLQRLPRSLSRCSKLVTLVLNHNEVHSVPSFVGHVLTKLTFIDLSSNPLRALPTSITNLKELSVFIIKETELPLGILVSQSAFSLSEFCPCST